MHSTLGDQSGNVFWRRGLGLGNQRGAKHPKKSMNEILLINTQISPVILHLLLAAEPFAASVALMEAGDVTPLVDHQVVSLAEASVTPTTIKSLSNRLDLDVRL